MTNHPAPSTFQGVPRKPKVPLQVTRYDITGKLVIADVFMQDPDSPIASILRWGDIDSLTLKMKDGMTVNWRRPE